MTSTHSWRSSRMMLDSVFTAKPAAKRRPTTGRASATATCIASLCLVGGRDSSACPTPERHRHCAQHALLGPAAQHHGKQTQEAAFASKAKQAACLKHSGLFMNRSPIAHSNCLRYGAKQPLLCNDAVQGIALLSTSMHEMSSSRIKSWPGIRSVSSLCMTSNCRSPGRP